MQSNKKNFEEAIFELTFLGKFKRYIYPSGGLT